LASWRVASQTPILQRLLVQSYVPDNPPFGLDAWLSSTLAQWQQSPWTQQRSTKLAPPSGAVVTAQPPRRTLPETILASWRALSQTPVLGPGYAQPYVPDNPPFGLDAWLSSTLAQWQVAPWPQQRNAKLIQEAVAAAAANPSFDQSWVWGVLNQWQAAPALIAQARNLSSGIPGQSVDDPPRTYRADNRIIRLWDAPPPSPSQKGSISSGIPGQSVDNPPNRAAELRAALVSWQPPAPIQIQYARYIQQIAIAAADNPPFGVIPPWSALGQWQARTLTKIEQALVIPEFVAAVANNPPFGMPQDWLFGTLGQWQITPPAPALYRKLVQEFVAAVVNNPPFGIIRPWSALNQWQARTLTKIEQALVIPEFVAAVANNPPFGMPPKWFLEALAYWQIIPPPIVRARNLSPAIPGQSIDQPPGRILNLTWVRQPRWAVAGSGSIAPLIPPAIVNNPPFGMPQDWLFGTLGQWQIIVPTPIRYNRLVQEFVAAVVEKTPFNQGWFWAVLNQWPATAPIIQARKLSAGIPGQSVDLPPPRTPSFITPVKLWEPAVIVPQRRIYYPQPFVVVTADNPPFGMPPDWLWVALSQWEPRTLTRIEQGLIGQEGPLIIIVPPSDYRKIITLRGDRIDVILG